MTGRFSLQLSAAVPWWWREPPYPPLLYLAITLAWSWPLPLHLANRFTHDPGDPLLVTYLMWWNAHAVPLTEAWWNAPYFVPLKHSLALTEHLAGLSPISTPLQWLGASPLLAYNLVLIASTWWSGLAMHALVRRLTGATAAAFFAGLAFAFAPYRTSQLGHLQLYACWWLPLLLLSLHHFYDDRRARWLVVLGASWALQGLTNGYYLLFVPVLLAFWVAWHTRRDNVRALAGVACAGAAAATLVLPFLLVYYRVQTAQGLARSMAEMLGYSATPGAFLSATPLLAFLRTPSPPSTEQFLFPGVAPVALIVAGLGLARSDSRFRFYAAAAMLMTFFSAGPSATWSLSTLWHPYTFLAVLPGFGGLRVPARFFMLAVVCLVTAAGIAFAHVQRAIHPRRTIVVFCAAAFAAVVFDGTIRGMPLGVPPGRMDISEPGARVMVLPFSEGRVVVAAMYQAMHHGRELVNGYAGYIPTHADAIDWALHRHDPTVVDELRRGHPLYIVVTPHDEAEAMEGWVKALPGAELTGVQSGGSIYRLPALPYVLPVRPGRPLQSITPAIDGPWAVLDLGHAQTVRSLELRTHGDFVRLPETVRVDVSQDGHAWTSVFEERPGAMVLRGALEMPRIVPLRVDLKDAFARYVRANVSGFRVEFLQLYTP